MANAQCYFTMELDGSVTLKVCGNDDMVDRVLDIVTRGQSWKKVERDENIIKLIPRCLNQIDFTSESET